MILGPVLGGIAAQLMGFTMVIWVLVLVRVLQGLSTARRRGHTQLPVSANRDVGKLRGRVMGFYEAATVVGLALGGWLAGQLYGRFGALSFTIVAVAYVLALLPFLFVAIVPGCEGQVVARQPAVAHVEPSHHALRPSLAGANAVLGAWFSVARTWPRACPTGRSS